MAKVGLAEAAQILGVSSETVRRRLKKGELTGEKIKTDHGYQWVVELEDLAPEGVPTTVVDVVELKRALAPEDLAALVHAAQAPLINQLEQQAQVIDDLAAKVEQLTAAIEAQAAAPKTGGFWSRLFGYKR